MKNNSSVKTILESYAAIPLLLISLAAIYRFGFFFHLDALWILPSLSIQSLLYSILSTILLFISGCSLTYLYIHIQTYLGHIFALSLFFTIICIILGILYSNENFSLILKSTPLLTGSFYYTYVHYSLFSSELDRAVFSPLVIVLSLVMSFMMFSNGVNDAKLENLQKKLSIVNFSEQPKDSSENTDWRLLENLGDKFILIDLSSGDDTKNYRIKVVEYKTINTIY
ncbi:hypothetical protein [Acinetobacter soli]|uniref:hypothetical protein n=1 Tax=Acinetobacter soli TaxID=487316 RepID=UPI0026E0E81C|nr:hypothetical protein [Acinetobacter soli]